MPYSGEHPDQHGWPGPGIGPFEDLVIDGMTFPDGCRKGHSIIWQRVWDVLKSGVPGGLYRPGSTWDGKTQTGGDWKVLQYPDGLRWEQYGGELREKRGQDEYSIHSWWLACDFNSGHNPFQVDPPDPSPYRLPPDTQERLDAEFGVGAFLWGGRPDWGTRKDWMHIQMQLTPGEASALAAKLAAHGGTTPTGDWFDMATKDELAEVVAAALAAQPKPLNAQQTGYAVWSWQVPNGGTNKAGKPTLSGIGGLISQTFIRFNQQSAVVNAIKNALGKK